MSLFAVAHSDLQENVVEIDFVESENEREAVLSVMEKTDEDRDRIRDSFLELEEVLQYYFDGDFVVGVKEVPT